MIVTKAVIYAAGGLLLASLAAMIAATIALGRLAAPRVDAAPSS